MRTLTFNRVIGSGAMGTVYHAELRAPRGFSRTCAVKVMKQSAADHEHFLARMRDEARLLGMLQDEQVLGVSELVQVEGRDAVIMEFVEGVDLADLIKDGTIPAKALAELGAELAGTLYRAHQAKHPQTGEPLRVIHRDVKPANVMLTTRGGVRLLDFGVARAAFDSRESQTQGLVLGTLNYFPPEILAGQDPTPAVDIYGLGLSLWECAAAKEWGAPRVQQKRFEERVERRLSELRAEYAPLVPVLQQVFHWDPKKRPSGADVEKLLLAAAERCGGAGLRTWAREAVPALLEKRSRASSKGDPLVGRTIEVSSLGGESAEDPGRSPVPAGPPVVPGPPPVSAPPPPPRPTIAPEPPPPPSRRSAESNPRASSPGARPAQLPPETGLSYDDMGPPAPVVARKEPRAPDVDPRSRSGAQPGTPRPRKQQGGPGIFSMACAGMVVGGLVGLLALAVIVLVALLMR